MSLIIGKTTQKYITAITTPYHGYAVVIPHPNIVGNFVKKNFFGISRSQDDYLASAIVWRDQTYASLYGCALPQRSFHRKEKSNTNIPGVRKIEKVVKKKLRNGTVREYRVACILAEVFTIPGKNYAKSRGSKSKLYSINKYGEDEATRLAIEWRKNMLKVLAISPV